MLEFMRLVSSVLVLKWVLTGMYPWLRYGLDGVRFIFSKDFPDALQNWQREQNYVKRCAEEAVRFKEITNQ